ncbi:MAG: hypothetical protein WAM27_04540, partial [Nitrososphaeraceae archaeon]
MATYDQYFQRWTLSKRHKHYYQVVAKESLKYHSYNLLIMINKGIEHHFKVSVLIMLAIASVGLVFQANIYGQEGSNATASNATASNATASNATASNATAS